MLNPEDVIDNMVEIEIVGTDGFRKVKETLTRMGVSSKTAKVLNQSAHILHRRGKYYICHFKEMFSLDGLRTDINEGDVERRNRIAQMLEDWGLVRIVNPDQIKGRLGHPSVVRVIKYGEKDDWELKAKYTIGADKHRNREYEND